MEIVNSFSDEDLLRQIKKGNNMDEVIKYLYRSCFTIANKYVKQNTGSQEDSEDIFQDAVVSFIHLVQMDKFRGDCSIVTFMYTLVRNAWLNELKKRKRARLREEKYERDKVTADPDAAEVIMHREMKSQIIALIETLGENCKKILLAFYYENLSMQEMLVSLPYENEQVVRNKKYKCLQKLQEILALKPEVSKNLKSILYYGQ